MIDLGQMEQVLINLAVNARDAMENGGNLKIETKNFDNKKAVKCGDDEMPKGHWVNIAVTDTGHGITKENMNRILEPFFTTKDVGQGTGLGLATVYGIIRQTGGYLCIDSEVNKGTEVIGAENGGAAVKLLDEHDQDNIDLLITDVMMPDMDGPTLAKHMREHNSKLKIIFISGYTEDRLKDHMGENIYFLPKPFTLKQLAQKVKEALED